MENMKIILSPEVYITQLEALTAELEKRDDEIQRLKIIADYERELRVKNEVLFEDVKPKTRKKREVTPENNTYSEYKSNGVLKPRAAKMIRSYDEFDAMQRYFYDKGQIRNWAMWRVGVALGLRNSDLAMLRFRHFINEDGVFQDRIKIYEQKSGKLNNCLITDAVKVTLEHYFSTIKRGFDLDAILFASVKTKEGLTAQQSWKILSDAGKALGLSINIGSHTMRRSFANIAACVDKSCIDMNSITKIQGLLNHSDQRVTMRYLNSYQDMYDRARVAVSDFILGETDINEIVVGNQYTADDVMKRLDAIEAFIANKGV